MKQTTLETAAVGTGALVLAGWLVYWSIQVMDVIELLKLAYG